jgi:energy-coupling factor transport system ATP-binding protein
MERAEDDVAFGLENRGWELAAMRERVPEALAEVGLAGFGRRRAIRLSGGERQRLALAGVLAPRPGLLILDEPTANLDPDGARRLFEAVAAIRERRSATIVIVAHDADAAWPLADRVLALAIDGAPIDVGPPREVLERSRGAMAAAGIWLPGDSTAAARRPAAARPPVGAPPMVNARSVAFGFDRRVPFLRADVEIAAGERLGLVGPNGSGKSTLGRLLVGLLRPSSGTIRLAGDDPARLPAAELARRAGYVFQEPERQFLAGTVGEEVRLGLHTDERPGADVLMDRIGLPLAEFGDRSPYLLSGGEQRRLSVACILVRRPGLLVLDEPTFGQDRRGHEALLEIVRERVGEGTAVVAATHDERFVAAFAERVVRMRDGRIEAVA